MLKSIGIIPDGNRRYSKKAGIELYEAYVKGFEKAEEVFKWCLRIPSLKTATIYALSTENLRRKKEELEVLTELYDKYFRRLADHKLIHENKVRVKIVGERELIPERLMKAIRFLEEKTKGYTEKILSIALGYGGRMELFNAFKKTFQQNPNPSVEAVSANLYVPQDTDLIIRTGANQRLSNFLLWQAAYSELYFTKKLWPEFDKQEFDKAIEFYNSTQRNFGR